jgi:hypothetical protein
MTQVYKERRPRDQKALPGHREYRIKDFTGEKAAKGDDQVSADECLGWLKRFNRLAEQLDLSHEDALELLHRHVTGTAGAVLEDAQQDEPDLNAAYVALETAFAGLRHPDVAMEDCRKATRGDKEDLNRFGQRVRFLARMGTRDRADRAGADLEVHNVAMTTFMAAMNTRTKEIMQERQDGRRKRGEPEPTYTALVREAADIEARREANQKIYKERHPHQTKMIRRLECLLAGTAEDDDAEDDEDQAVEHLVERVVAGVTRRVEKKKPPTESKVNVRMASAAEAADDSVNVLAVGQMRLSPAALGVERDECMRCGGKGHRAFGPDSAVCGLRHELITDTPCPKCKKGGHLEKHCQRVLDYPKN